MQITTEVWQKVRVLFELCHGVSDHQKQAAGSDYLYQQGSDSLCGQVSFSQNYRITETWGLERTSGDHLVHQCPPF